MILEGRSEAAGRGGEVVRHKALGVCSAHSTLIHSPGSWLSLRLWFQVEAEMGTKKCCRLVDISCNYNFSTCSYLHLQVTRPVGLLMTAALRKGPGWMLQKSIPNTTDFQEANCKDKFSPHPLTEKKSKQTTPNSHRTRCSASLIVTGGIPIKSTRNHMPSDKKAI